MDNKKTFEGWELAKALKEGKFKDGTKFTDEFYNKYTVSKCGNTYNLSISDPPMRAFELINRTFTLIAEPKLYYFNQVRKTNKKIRIKGWNKFVNLQGALDTLSTYNDKVINEAFTKKVWEVQE